MLLYDLMKIGESLRAFRKSRQLGQADIAAIADAAISTISEWEKGKYNPELSKLIKIAQHFNVPLDTLVFFNQESKDKPTKEESELLKKYRNAPKHLQDSIRLILK